MILNEDAVVYEIANLSATIVIVNRFHGTIILLFELIITSLIVEQAMECDLLIHPLHVLDTDLEEQLTDDLSVLCVVGLKVLLLVVLFDLAHDTMVVLGIAHLSEKVTYQ